MKSFILITLLAMGNVALSHPLTVRAKNDNDSNNASQNGATATKGNATKQKNQAGNNAAAANVATQNQTGNTAAAATGNTKTAVTSTSVQLQAGNAADAGNIDAAVFTFPASVAAAGFAVPAANDAVAHIVALANGTQNYNCDAATGQFVSTGPLATLVDCTALVNTAAFATAQNDIAASGFATFPPLGQHFFVGNQPVFDFTAAPSVGGDASGASQTFVAVSAVPAADPVDPTNNVNWLAMQAGDGAGLQALSKFVFLTDVAGGQAPAGKCDPATTPTLEVPFAAKYLFFIPP